MMNKDKVLSLIGLCQRARLLVSGEEFSLDKIKNNQARLVFLAKDASQNTSKRILDKSKFYGVDVVQSFSSDELSNAIGKSNRKVIAIKDKGFADKMKSLLL